jgi:hypothetical protein
MGIEGGSCGRLTCILRVGDIRPGSLDIQLCNCFIFLVVYRTYTTRDYVCAVMQQREAYVI